MSTSKPIVGTCLCGSVTVRANPPKPIFDACHCGMCRKWGGGPAMTIEGGDGFKIAGEEFVTVYSSSKWAERGFCKQCGTHLFYRLKNSNFCNFTAGLFKETDDFKFQVQIFVDAKPPCYDFANQTAMMTEAEVIAMFAGKK